MTLWHRFLLYVIYIFLIYKKENINKTNYYSESSFSELLNSELSLSRAFSKLLSFKPSILATWCEELTHLKRPWCWERLREGGEGDNRGRDGWMASPTQWTWVWVNFGSWWWTGRPGVLQSMGLQRVGHDWVTELNWTELNCFVTHVDFSWGLVLSCLPSLCSLSWQTHPHSQLNYHVHTHEVPNLYFHLSPLVWPSDWYIQMPTGLVWKDVWKPTQAQLVPQTWSSCSLPYFSWLVYHSIQWYLEIFWYHLVPPSLWNFLLGRKSNFAYFFVYCLLPKTLGIHSLLSIFILTMLPSTSFLDYCSISSCTNIHSDLFC